MKKKANTQKKMYVKRKEPIDLESIWWIFLKLQTIYFQLGHRLGKKSIFHLKKRQMFLDRIKNKKFQIIYIYGVKTT